MQSEADGIMLVWKIFQCRQFSNIGIVHAVQRVTQEGLLLKLKSEKNVFSSSLRFSQTWANYNISV